MTEQERVAMLCVRALQALRLGFAILDGPTEPCTCRYPDGSPRYTTPDDRMAHRCGR